MRSVRAEYLLEFKGGETLLLEGDARGLIALADALEALARGNVAGVQLHSTPFLSCDHEFLASREDRDIGLASSDGRFLWRRTAEGWLETVDKIRALLEHGSGHQYLDGPRDELQVMVSTGEGYERLHVQ